MEDTFQGKTVYINGTKVYFEENKIRRTAETLVLLHGFLSSSFSFRKLLPYLVSDYHVVSVDLPPFGESDKNKKFRYSYKNMAVTVLALMDHLNIKTFSIAGHSMGGQIALNVMRVAPDRIKKGILLSSSGYYPRAKKHHILASYLPFFSVFVKHFLSKTGVVGNLRSVVYDQTMIDESMIRGYSKQFEDPKIFAALALLLRHREGDLTVQALHSIHTPCLLIWGEHDRIVPLDIGKRLSDDLPYARLVVLKNTGHLVPEEKPEEVFELIHTFLESEN